MILVKINIKMEIKKYLRTKEYLDKLFYEVNQQRDFQIQILKDGFRTKRKMYSEICHDFENKENQLFLMHVNQRQILPCEIVIDLEERKNVWKIVTELTSMNLTFYVYDTGSRGVHIHIFFKKDLTEEEKLKIIQYFGGDSQLASNKHMIALEYVEHWKSGRIKEEIKWKSD